MYKKNVRKNIKSLAKKNVNGNLVLAFLVVVLGVVFSTLFVYLITKIFGYEYSVNLVNYLLLALIYTLTSPFILLFGKLVMDGNRGKQFNYQESLHCFRDTKFIKLSLIVILVLIFIYWLIGLIPVAGFFINFIILLLFIPFVVLLPFIYLEYKDLKLKDIIGKGLDVISGNRIGFYGLVISFSFWFILSILTIGILSFYVMPYLYLALSNFYLYISHEKEFKRQQAIGDGNLIIVFIGVLTFLVIFLLVNFPASKVWFMQFITGEVSRVGDATLSYGGITITYDSPVNYQTSAETDSSKTYVNNDNYNILQYSIYLATVDDSREMDKEIVQEMKDSGNYRVVNDSQFTIDVHGKKIKGYRYDAEEDDGSEVSSVMVYYPRDSFTITIGLTNSTGKKINIDDIKEFVTIY